MTLSRRDFLETAAGVPWIAPAAQRPEWFDRPMRWAQLTLVENDPGRYPNFRSSCPPVTFLGLLGARIPDKPKRLSFVFTVRRRERGDQARRKSV
jgi:hypothetical protein